MLPNNTLKNNRVFAPMIVGVALLLITLVLYPLYTNYVDATVEIASLQKTKDEKQAKITKIKEMQAHFGGSGSTDIAQKVKKYNHLFNTSDIMEAVMVNNHTKETAFTPAQVNIGSIAIDAGKKLPNGLSLATVSLSLSADTPDQIVDYLTYLTTESTFAFTVDSISLPLDTVSSATSSAGVSLSIALGVYYYE